MADINEELTEVAKMTINNSIALDALLNCLIQSGALTEEQFRKAAEEVGQRFQQAQQQQQGGQPEQ